MPSNISSNDGLWATAKDLSLRKQRKSAPMKERLSNFSSSDNDIEDVSQSPSPAKKEPTLSKKQAKSLLSKSLASAIPDDVTPAATSSEQNGVSESPATATPPAPVIAAAKTKRSLFGARKSTSSSKDKSTDKSSVDSVFRFEGDGLVFRGKLIGIKDVTMARGDEMCQLAMQDLNNGIKQSKEHKMRIVISVSLAGLKIKDEKATIAMHHHAIPKISYIWRDQTDARSFGYVYGTPDSGHRFVAMKVAEKSADTLVSAIHELFQVAFSLKQREVELAKKGQDDSASNGSDDSNASKKENSPEINGNQSHRKVDEANLLDLETELFNLSQGLEQMNAMPLMAPSPQSSPDSQSSWADFGGSEHGSSASSSSGSSSDPWGRGSTPQSLRTITPDPFDTMVQYQGQILAAPIATPRPMPVLAQSSSWSTASLTPSSSSSLFPAMGQSMPTNFTGNAFGALSVTDGPNPFGSYQTGSFSSFPAEGNLFGASSSDFELEGGFSVFDPPPPPPAPKEEKKTVDPFATGPELFGDILQFGAPRTEKTSKNSFPQPIKPTIAGLRGEPSILIPAPTTVDPFFITSSAMGLSVSVSPPNHSYMMEFMNAAGQQPTRRISQTNAPVVAPSLPPRPLAALSHSNSAGAFGGLAPPPAPRRSAAPLPGLTSSYPFGSMSANSMDAFADPFFQR